MSPISPALFHPRPPSARQCLRPSRTPDFSSSVMLSPHVSSDAKDGEFALGRGRPSVTKDSLHGRWNSSALRNISLAHVRLGSFTTDAVEATRACMSAVAGGLNGSTRHSILKGKDGGFGNASRLFSRLYGIREDRALGSLAAGRVAERDWASVW